jgi:cytochrome c-type biogenesis protein CcmH/NrfG
MTLEPYLGAVAGSPRREYYGSDQRMTDDDIRRQQRNDAKLTQYQKGSGEGVDELRQQLASDPDNLTVKEWLAFSLYTNNLFEEAVDHYRVLVEREPKKSSHAYYLANCYARKGKIQEAMMLWERVVLAGPTTSMGRKAKARFEEAQRILKK